MAAVTSAPSTSRYGFKQVVRSELIKITTLRSMLITLVIALVGSLGVTVLGTFNQGGRPPGGYQGFDPTNQSMVGLALATLAFGVLGAMAATGEYATGTIRSTLSAAPRRPILLAAKITTVGLLALLAGEVITFSCFGLGQAILAGAGTPTANLSQHGVLPAIILSGAFVALMALMALGLGVIVRHTAGAITTYVGITFLLPFLLARFASTESRYTPVIMLANSVSAVYRQNNAVNPSAAMILMTIYAAVVLTVAAVLIVRRDA
jgi:ABC-2 type transport system permease protein